MNPESQNGAIYAIAVQQELPEVVIYAVVNLLAVDVFI